MAVRQQRDPADVVDVVASGAGADDGDEAGVVRHPDRGEVDDGRRQRRPDEADQGMYGDAEHGGGLFGLPPIYTVLHDSQVTVSISLRRGGEAVTGSCFTPNMYVVRDVEGLAEGSHSLAELGRRIVAGAAEMASFQASWLQLVAEFDRRDGWVQDGVRSCAHWLGWRCGIELRTAREHVNVARALEGLPTVRALFAEGRLSYSKVRAVCRVATDDNEAMLVE